MFAMMVNAQCCDPSPAPENSYEGVVYINDTREWNGVRFVNGSLVINGALSLVDCNLTIAGEGIIISENAVLEMDGSTVEPLAEQVGYFIESFGSLIVRGSTLRDCLDPNNDLFSIYIENGSFEMENSRMERSGTLQSHLPDISIIDSTIPGVITLSGDLTLERCRIEGLGASALDGGDLTVKDSSFHSNLSYSQNIAALSDQGGNISLENVSIDGTYGGGVFVLDSTVNMSGIVIDLPGGLYGLKMEDVKVSRMDGIRINGTYGGMDLKDVLGESILSDIRISGSSYGLLIDGIGAVLIRDALIRGPSHGIISSSAISLNRTIIKDVEVGLLLQGGFVISEMDADIINFTRWGVEVESWAPPDVNGIVFQRGGGAISDTALWGRIHVKVRGPDGLDVDGAELHLKSNLEMEESISSGEVGVVWAFMDHDGTIHGVNYTLHGKWGNAERTLNFTPVKDMDVELVLPLTDVRIEDLSFVDGEAIVRIGAEGSEAKEVVVTIYLDGSYRFNRKENLATGEEKVLRLPVGNMDAGTHILKCEVSSRDEYSGNNRALMENNILEITIEKEEDRGADLEVLGILVVAAALLSIGLVLLLRRKD